MPLAVNLPSLMVCSLPSIRLLLRALMRRSDAIIMVNLRVWFSTGKCTTTSSV